MRKIIFFLLISLLCFSYATAQSESLRNWDFGAVKKGEILNHDFIFKNETSGVLKIKDIHSSCGCTASKIKKDVLGKGESTSVQVKFNSAGYSGKVTQHVYMRTDNQELDIVTFTINADVR